MSDIFNYLLSCSFVLGRAGSGKTYGCLAAIAAELRRYPRGRPLILLAPEQATAQLERRLATWPGVPGGTARARVFSFQHLAREAFLRAGGAPGRQLGELGRIMLLRQAMLRRQGELTALGRSAAQAGVAEAIGRTLLEFQNYGWRLEDLEAWIAAEILQEGEQGLTLRKARDLAILWRDLEAALAAGGWEDPARLPELAARAIRRSAWLDHAAIWVDGFASFTAQETAILDALLEKAERVTFALCLDPGHLELIERAGGSLRPRVGMERMFENIEETYQALKSRVQERGLDPRRIVTTRLPEPDQPARYDAAPVLAHLERHVLGRIHPAPCPDTTWNQSQISNLKSQIELIEASDRRAEVEAVARRLVTLCRRDGEAAAAHPLLLWREVAVLARDLAPYEVHLREVFGTFRIPYFLDRPRSVQGHPLTRSILSALGVLRSGWTGDAMLHHLKCGLSGLRDENAIGAIENAIRATDPRGAQWLRRLERDEALRAPWLQASAPLRRLESDLIPHSPSRAIWAYLEAIEAAPRLEAWIAEARARGDEETVQIHEQAWEQTVAWLEELEKIQQALPDLFLRAGQSPRERIQELMDLVEAALASTQARLIPPTLNQVTVGAVDRSRTPEVKAVFVIGMNEGEFPRLWQPDPLLGDEERDRLTRGGRRLGPDTQRKRLQEHFLAYIALTRSSERLILSRPQVDDQGRVCDPSPYFTLVAQVCPRAPVRPVKRCGEGEDPALPLRPEEWALRLGLELARAEAVIAPALFNHCAALRGHPELAASQRRALERAHALLDSSPPARLDGAAAARFWGEGGALPVTALENYGECPFKFFAQRMLRLERRQEASFNIQELGTLRHEVLNRLYRRLAGPGGLNWGRVDPAVADDAIDAELALLCLEEPWQGRLDASALGGMAVETVAEELKLFVRALRLAGGRSRFQQVASEWTFGLGGELTIEAGGRRFVIRGSIDRVDALPETADAPRASLLIDYKSGRRQVSLARIVEGIDLQLLTYALAWRKARERDGDGPMRIGGVFYWPLAAPVREAAPEEDQAGGETVDDRWFEDVRPSGIFIDELADLLDCQVAPGGKALAFGFRKTAAGTLHGAGQGHWTREGIENLLLHEERLLERLAGRIVEGRIDINPFALGQATACDHCDYTGLCRKAGPVEIPLRRLTPLRRDDIIESLG